MHILLFPVGFILWYLAYEAKPIINDEVKLHWEGEKKNSVTLAHYKCCTIFDLSQLILLCIF